MDIRKTVKNYEKAWQEIAEYFGGLTGHGPPDNLTDYYWYFREGSRWISYEEDETIVKRIIEGEIDLDDHEFTYGYDIIGTGVWIKDEYSMFFVDNMSGEQFLALFDSSKRLK